MYNLTLRTLCSPWLDKTGVARMWLSRKGKEKKQKRITVNRKEEEPKKNKQTWKEWEKKENYEEK